MKNIIRPIVSIVLALIAGALVIAAVGEDPGLVYQAMLSGAFGGKTQIASTLVKTTTMIFVGLSYGYAYRCGLVNIGIDGQLYMGGLLAAVTGIYLPLPAILHIPVCLVAGFAGGALWGALVGWLKNRFRASEMITTVMLNYVATYFVGWLVNGPLKEEKGTFPQSEDILASAQLPVLVPKTQLSIALILAVIAILLYDLFWKKTADGFAMQVVGDNAAVAQYAGIDVKKTVMRAMIVSGGLGGLAGCAEVLGVQHKILEGLSAGYGFDGIAVSLLGANSGVGIFFSSLLFGAMRTGGNAVQMFTDMPMAVIYILQSFVIIFVVMKFRLPSRLTERVHAGRRSGRKAV